MEKKIGQLIKNKLDASNLSVSDFARLIDVERSNVYNIFKRESIDTELLKKIGHILKYDFFQDLLEEETRMEILFKNRIENTIYVPIKLTDSEIEKLDIKEKVIKELKGLSD